MTARKTDTNGWFEIPKNPISKVGVFPYMGYQLGKTGEDARRVFQVYRPAEELSDPEAMDSFRLVPFIDDHTMLGDGPGLTPAEKKGVHGVTGDRVVFEGDTLYSNLKVFSSSLTKKIDKDRKREISLGYRCVYDFTPGVFQGKAYDAVQRRLRGNHGALVDKGRMGSNVAVLDHMTFTVDAEDFEEMHKLFVTAAVAALEVARANNAPQAVIDACDAAVKTAQDAADPDEMSEDAKAKVKAAEDAKALAEQTAADSRAALDAANAEVARLKGVVAAAASATGQDAAVIAALDEAKTEIARLTKAVEDAKAVPVMDEAAMFKAVAKRDDLVRRLSPHVGVFDHAGKTLTEVVSYGMDKLKLTAPAGHELTALDAYLAAKPAPTPTAKTVNTADASDLPKESAVSRYLSPAA
jgi:hypothetical protein